MTWMILDTEFTAIDLSNLEFSLWCLTSINNMQISVYSSSTSFVHMNIVCSLERCYQALEFDTSFQKFKVLVREDLKRLKVIKVTK